MEQIKYKIVGGKYKYLRVCPCGDERWVSDKPHGIIKCRSCASKGVRKEVKTTYTRVCECGDIKELKYKPKQDAKCKSCNIKYHTKRLNDLKKENKVRHFRICPECPEDENIKEVGSASGAGIRLCRKHSNQKIVATRKKREVKAKSEKPKRYSTVGTDGAKRNKVTVKFQTVDLETFEETDVSKRKRKEKEIPKTPRELELQMQEEWLKKNKVKEC